MRIAMIAPLAESVPPQKYGGTERVVHFLTEELVRRGHEVTLFASGDSKTKARLYSVIPQSLRAAELKNPYGLNEWNFLNFGIAYSMQDQFDVIHDHNYTISLPTANLSKTPVVMTVHSAFHDSNLALFRQFSNVNLVTISQSHAKLGKDVNVLGTVYNGLEMAHYPFSRNHDGYLLYVGRMHEEKGVHHAIEVAQTLNKRLIIAGRVAAHEEKYFENHVKPHLNDQIQFVGEVNEKERNELMKKALCFLHPVTWPEPFGLTLIESLACGAPVIAFDKGSISEIVQNGKTGFIVKNVEQMIAAVSNLDQIDREYCRHYALKTFNVKNMVDGYEKMYQRALDNAFLSQPLPFLGDAKVPTNTSLGSRLYNQILDKASVNVKQTLPLQKASTETIAGVKLGQALKRVK